MITILFYIVSLLGILILGFFTYSRRSEKSGIYFSFMSFALAAWLGCQFLAIRFPSTALGLTIAGLVAFSFIPPLCVLFTIEFISFQSKFRHLITRASVIGLAILLITALVPGTIQKASVSNGGLVIQTGTLYTVQTVLAVLIVLFAIILFAWNFRKFIQTKRLAAYYFVLGLAIAVTGNLVSGYILSNDSSVQFIGPFSILLMTGLITYSITRHKLFDIRAAVARTVAYSLSILILIAAFFLISTNLISKYIHNESLERLINAIILVLFVLVQQPLKRLLDKISNSIFYRDAYDTQAILNQTNNLFLRTIDAERLTTETIKIIQDAILTFSSGYVLLNRKGELRKVYTSGGESLDIDIDAVTRLISRSPEVLAVSKLPDNQVREQLDKANIDIIAGLKTKGSFMGWMFLSGKKNGSEYTEQDVRLFLTISQTLAIAVENALRFEEIQGFNITLQEKVDIATRQLRKTNEKLRALDETKDEFISMASHQLRTPLTSMKGYVSMVLEGDTGKINNDQKDLLNQAFASSQRMVYLIADLLNVSRLKTGKFVIENKPTNLADIIEGEISQLIETAKAKNLELTYEKPKDFPVLMLDETKIRQVIMNFADNAIYYTPSGGHINVKLINNANTVEFTVVDDGIGVPKAEAHHLFSKFYRAGNAKKARPDGTGLGLFMAKKVIVAQGGALIFNSEEGKGSTFGFTLSKEKFKADPKKLPKPTIK